MRTDVRRGERTSVLPFYRADPLCPNVYHYCPFPRLSITRVTNYILAIVPPFFFFLFLHYSLPSLLALEGTLKELAFSISIRVARKYENWTRREGKIDFPIRSLFICLAQAMLPAYRKVVQVGIVQLITSKCFV